LVRNEAQPAPRQPEQRGSRPRHRLDGPRPHARTSNQAAQPADVAHQRWYIFPILLLLGLLMHHEAIRRVISPAKIQRRWVEISFLMLRLEDSLLWSSSCSAGEGG